MSQRSVVDEVTLYMMSRLTGIRISVLLSDGTVWGVNELDTFEQVANNSGFIFAYLGSVHFVLTRQLDNIEFTQGVRE